MFSLSLQASKYSRVFSSLWKCRHSHVSSGVSISQLLVSLPKDTGINCYLLIHWQTTTYDLKLHLLLIEHVLCVCKGKPRQAFLRTSWAYLCRCHVLHVKSNSGAISRKQPAVTAAMGFMEDYVLKVSPWVISTYHQLTVGDVGQCRC